MDGDTAGRYRILRTLTSASTGPLCLAEDVEGGRRFLLKILASGPLAEESLKQALIREARAAASLVHPRVPRCLGMQEAGGQTVLVYEDVGGEPLTALLAKGPAAERDVLEAALDVLSALEAAHAHGLLHCDIQPDHILLDPDRRAWLVGLGLGRHAARFRPSGGPAAGASEYLAPEETRGESPDGRTDLFSLSAVLYRWLTGSAALPGVTGEAGGAARAATRPVPPEEKVPGVTKETSEILLGALESEPASRFRDAHEMRERVREARRALGPMRLEPEPGEAPGPGRTSGMLAWFAQWKVLIPAAAVVFAAMALLGMRARRTPAPPPAQGRPVVMTQVTDWPGTEMDPAISADGQRVVFASDASGNLDLWVADLRAGTTTQITRTPEDERNPDWSPDGRRLVCGVLGEGGGVLSMAPDGTDRKLLAPAGERPRWSPKGNLIAFDARTRTEKSRIWLMSPEGQTLRLLSTAESPDEVHTGAAWSPDGSNVLFERQDGRSQNIWAVLVENRAQRPVTRSWMVDFDACWDPSGTWIYFCSGVGDSVNIYRTVAEGGRRLRMTREAGCYSGLCISSDSRRIVFSTVEDRTSLWRVRVPEGVAERCSTGLDRIAAPDVGRVSGSVVVASDREGSWDLYAIEGGVPTMLTRGPGDENEPRWSPDESALVYVRKGEEGTDLRWLKSGGGEEKNLFSGVEITDPVWSPAGGSVAFVEVETPHRKNLWIAEVASGKARRITEAGLSTHPRWSPDGTSLCFHSVGDAWSGIFTIAAEGEFRSRLADGRDPGWMPDGAGLVYSAGEAGREDLRYMDIQSFAERRLTDDRAGYTDPVVSPDGRWVAFLTDAQGSPDLWVLSLDGGDPVLVAADTQPDGSPLWSPDSRWLYYLREEHAGGDIWMYETQ